MGGPYAGGDGALDADAGLPCEKGDASRLGLFSGAPGVHHGCLQCPGPVAWLPAQRLWVRASLDCRVWSVKYQYCCLVCQRLTPLVGSTCKRAMARHLE